MSESEVKHDIITKEDIHQLVDVFYSRMLKDDIVKSFFDDIDFEHHKPRIAHFWSFVLLDEPGYTTNVFEKHAHMKLKEEHFDRWMFHFENTIDELFSGEKAETAKLRARTLAWTFKEKFKKMES